MPCGKFFEPMRASYMKGVTNLYIDIEIGIWTQ